MSVLSKLKETLICLKAGRVTLPYPAQARPVPEKFRGRPIFDAAKCIGCAGCANNCPAREILVVDLCQEVRILQYQRPGFRTSWLITSLLDPAELPYEELVGLYHQRWRQETFHREWKHTLQLANLRSHSPSGICKEVFVQLTLNNAVRAPPICRLPVGDGANRTRIFMVCLSIG